MLIALYHDSAPCTKYVYIIVYILINLYLLLTTILTLSMGNVCAPEFDC
jgi:hypothetical protein